MGGLTIASISQRVIADGTLRFDARVRVDGRVLTKTFRHHDDALRWSCQVARPRGRNTSAPALSSFATNWIAHRTLAPRTRELYEDLFGRHIDPTLGRLPLTALTEEGIERWWNGLVHDTGWLQAAKAYRLLHAILNTARDDHYLAANPCAIHGAGREHSDERALLLPAQVSSLADAIDARYRLVVLMAATGALRLGEILGLRRRHVRLESGTVLVEEQAQELRDGSVHLKAPKTIAGRRTVALPAFVAEELREHLDHHVAVDPDAWLFTGPGGGLLRRGVLHAAWTQARRRTGLSHITMHDLRHAGATYAGWSGASVRDLMYRMGHSTPNAAMRYQHAAELRDREIAERVGELFARGARDTAPIPRRLSDVPVGGPTGLPGLA